MLQTKQSNAGSKYHWKQDVDGFEDFEDQQESEKLIEPNDEGMVAKRLY